MQTTYGDEEKCIFILIYKVSRFYEDYCNDVI